MFYKYFPSPDALVRDLAIEVATELIRMAEGDPNPGVVIGDKFIMVSDATATPAMAQDLIARIRPGPARYKPKPSCRAAARP